jgi:hypothetical protein
MRNMRIHIIGAIAALMVIGGGAAAVAATSSNVAVQPVTTGVYACVNAHGGVDYMEFNAPIPHPCWFPGESLWQFNSPARVVVPRPSPSATRTVTVTNTNEVYPGQSSSDTTFTVNIPAGSHLNHNGVTASVVGDAGVHVTVVNVNVHTNVVTVSYGAAFTGESVQVNYSYSS